MPNQKTLRPNLPGSAVMRNQNIFSLPIHCINTFRDREEVLPTLFPTQINPLRASGVERGIIHVQKSERCSRNWDCFHDSYHEIDLPQSFGTCYKESYMSNEIRILIFSKEYYHSSSVRNIFAPEYMFVFCLYALICLYRNIPDLRFIASNGEICLYLSRLAEVKQLKYSVKTVLQRGRILSRFIRHKQLIISLINE